MIDIIKLMDWIDGKLLEVRMAQNLDYSAKIGAYNILIDLQEFIRKSDEKGV